MRSQMRGRRLARAAPGSLERRLMGGLLLIVVATLVLQFSARERSVRLHEDTQRLQTATMAKENANALAASVRRLQRLSAEYPVDSGYPGSRDEIVNTAMLVEQRTNALRFADLPLYRVPGGEALNDLDRHVAAILAPEPDAGLVERRGAAMERAAEAAQRMAGDRRQAAAERLQRASHRWHLAISALGALTILLVAAILFDLLRNVLPSLRRMHASLDRLAQGDLEVEIGRFDLAELQALSGAVETFRRNALAVRDLAFTDPETGLPNRRAFEERAAAALACGPPSGSAGHVLILADLDRFKGINEDYGHAMADELVRLVGVRIGEWLGADALVARVGGDEFAIFMPVAPAFPPARLASDLVAAMRQPFRVRDYQLAITLSIGLVTAAREQGEDVNLLLSRAELALAVAKQAGRNRAIGFTPDLEEERELERALERDLACALSDGGLRMVYQPILPLAEAGSGAERSREREVEALVRWRHPVLGEIPPARFIPAAERGGLMVQLGDWIVERSLSDLRRWPDLAMSINLSPLQLQQEGFAGFLTETCRINGIAANRLFLEVTESLSIERNARALLTLNLLRTLGFRIALDDFGTGYSSLSMLKTFRFDRLKLDRSLISDLATDPAALAVLDAAVTMALRIGAEVVAEGISDAQLVEPVRSAGCTHVQGFYYSRPIEAAAVADFYAGAAPALRVA